MVMDKNEIVYRWEHGAESPKEMVKILAQLNDCTEKEIINILFYARKLNGQAIYQYRKSGKLDCTDDEAAEFAKGKENEKAGKDETAGDPSQSAAPTAPPKGSREGTDGKKPVKLPEVVKAMLCEWLKDNRIEYEECLRIVRQYEEVEGIMKQEAEL